MNSPEPWKGQVSAERPNDSYIRITLRDNPFTYVLCQLNPALKLWDIEEINVYPPDKGIGKALVTELVKQLGPGQQVTAYVVEPDTIQRVLEAGWAQEAITHPLSVEKSEDLQTLKIVRLMQGGGMITTKCVVSWENYKDAGYTLQDIKDMRFNKLLEVSEDKVLTLHWFGKTPDQPVLQ